MYSVACSPNIDRVNMTVDRMILLSLQTITATVQLCDYIPQILVLYKQAHLYRSNCDMNLWIMEIGRMGASAGCHG